MNYIVLYDGNYYGPFSDPTTAQVWASTYAGGAPVAELQPTTSHPVVENPNG